MMATGQCPIPLAIRSTYCDILERGESGRLSSVAPLGTFGGRFMIKEVMVYVF